jgi:hypothetical protein
MLSTKRHIFPPLLHIVSQVSAHILPSRILSMPHSAPSHKEFHVRHLQTRVVSQGVVLTVVCVNSVYLSSRLLLWDCLCTYPRGSTLYSFVCAYHLPKRHDECPPLRFTSFPFHHSSYFKRDFGGHLLSVFILIITAE